jgi:Flp pilus assembly protein TadB
MLLAVSVMVLFKGVTGSRLVLVAGLCLAVAGIVATLWYSERRLTGLRLDRSVREVLEDMLNRVDWACRAYEMAYVGFIGCAAGAVVVIAWWQAWSGAWLTLAIVCGALAVLWARRSGRAYVDRMFGRYRSELSAWLEELDRP